MFQSSRIDRVELTPDLAHYWLEEIPFSGNRPIRPVHLRRMERVHRAGMFPETEASHCTVRGEDNRNLDSQHRCWMVINTGKSVSLNLKQYDTQTKQERIDLWHLIDQGAPRGFGQAIDADEWREAGYATKGEMAKVGPLLDWIEGKLTLEAVTSARESSIAEQSEFAKRMAPAAIPLFAAMADAPSIYRRLVDRKPVLAVLLPVARDPQYRTRIAALVHAVAHCDALPAKSAEHRFFQEMQTPSKDLSGKARVEFMRRLGHCIVRYLEDRPCVAIPWTPVQLPGTDIHIG